MENEENSNEEPFYDKVIKKTKTGITFPKELRDVLFNEDVDMFFRMIIPAEKNKIILEVISEEQAKQFSEKDISKTIKKEKDTRKKEISEGKKTADISPNFADYFVYDFEAKEKVKPILESAFYKFLETPVNLEDAMGRVKYALISFLSSTKTENAKLYFSVIKFLIDIIERFDQPNLLDWIFEKIIPNIESKFLYELALLELVDVSLRLKRYEKAEIYIFYVLKNIDSYDKSEMYNIMNSFKQLIKKVKHIERSQKIDVLLKEKLLEYSEGIGNELQDIDYKIQFIEFLEDLNFIELAFTIAKKLQMSMSPESAQIEQVRKLVRRLHVTPITEQKDTI
ncbi:MAG: hypothetical protein EU539_00635 [Promethearchaeota archaeon]|nr:MAG: hypothetical protein EU539_00635 [Candidatus Lokiarchaeota archaeon]